jgi:hypothetical protein
MLTDSIEVKVVWNVVLQELGELCGVILSH